MEMKTVQVYLHDWRAKSCITVIKWSGIHYTHYSKEATRHKSRTLQSYQYCIHVANYSRYRCLECIVCMHICMAPARLTHEMCHQSTHIHTKLHADFWFQHPSWLSGWIFQSNYCWMSAVSSWTCKVGLEYLTTEGRKLHALCYIS